MLAFCKISKLPRKILLVVVVMTSLCVARIPDDLKPISTYNDSDKYAAFRGTSRQDSTDETVPALHSLEGIQKIDRHFYIYAREHIFVVGAECKSCNNSLIPYKQVQKWISNENDSTLCWRKGQDKNNCRNFLKVFQLKIDNSYPSPRKQVMVCGTNSFLPKCRDYQLLSNGQLLLKEEKSGKLLCPSKPSEKVASLIADGNHYTATNGEFYGQDSIVLRSPVSSRLKRLRTSRNQDAQLYNPNFLRFVDGGNILKKVFVFMTEWAIEDNFREKYTRVGQVCKNDKGGDNLLQREFTSFFKARLNCSLPGQPPFYFNEMQDVTDLVLLNSLYGFGSKKIVFALMNTPRNSLPASAVCVFALNDINHAMNGPFLEKYRREGSEKVYWEKRNDIPLPHLASCDKNPRKLSHERLNFVSKHPLMHESVPAWNMKDDVATRSEPIFTRSRSRNFLTSVAVDTNAGLKSNYAVLWMGTEDGKVIKLVLLRNGQTAVVEERMVFNSKCGNTSKVVKKIVLDEASGTMMVAFESCVVRAPLCSLSNSNCGKKCVASRDPYCAWNGEKCVMFHKDHVPTNRAATNKRTTLTQDVEEGNTDGMSDCPVHGYIPIAPSISVTSSAVSNESKTTAIASADPELVGSTEPRKAEISLPIVLVVAIVSVAVGLVLGILIVHCFRRMKSSEEEHKHDAAHDEVTSNLDESKKVVSNGRSSGQSIKDKQRIASSSSQHNSNRNSANGERRRKRTETESSHGNKSDDDPVFFQSDEASHPLMSSDNDVPDAPHRNQLPSASGSTNGKNVARNSKQSSGSSNENVENLQSSPLKPHSYVPADSRREDVFECSLPRQSSNYISANGGIPDPNLAGSPPNHQVMRMAPNRSVSFQNPRPYTISMQSRTYSTGNKGANTMGPSHPTRVVNRQFSLQAHNSRPQTLVKSPQGYYSPQVQPPNWQPQFQENPNASPIRNMDNRKISDMTHSLDRRRHKPQNSQLPLREHLDGNQQMPLPNAASSRKRYASESENISRHLSSRPPQCQAIHEEQDLTMVYPVKKVKQNMTLNLQPHCFPAENGHMPVVNPALGRIASNLHSHSNPSTPSREMSMIPPEFATPIYQQAPSQNFRESRRQDSVESKSSPTKSNPATPMQDGPPSFLGQLERKRNYSGPNYANHQASSPVSATAPLLPHPNQQTALYPVRNRNYSGGNRPQVHLVNGISIENSAIPASPKSQFPITRPSLVSPT